ncbi:Hypothetical protein PHPALM_19924 [Phytophthora palmivora]|uniref:Uncharacterized protein n=1 Tax=Phytophthora palmivora TaxID=4796 RepID=A0A2P4XG52_9STRA|nr:Hypothetical protein PHPALM_19924 [Phytophthora palmivora]
MVGLHANGQQKRSMKQCVRMVKWRQQRKAILGSLHQEHQRLEDELQVGIAMAQMMQYYSVPRQHSVYESLRQLTIQCADLTKEKRQLQEAIENFDDFEHSVQNIRYRYGDLSGQVGISALSCHQGGLGWRVYFTDGSPSFHFNPFTRADFDHIIDESEAVRYTFPLSIGNILGWKVDSSPLTQSGDGTSFIAHTRFSKQLRCTLDHSQRVLTRVNPSLLPVLTTPKSWDLLQRGKMECQPLQQFGRHSYVIVCNIPSDVYFRYIGLARYSRKVEENGLRVDKYTLLIADSPINAYNRKAEEDQHNVQWILMDDHEYGEHLFIDWIRYAVHLEQLVSPAQSMIPTRIPQTDEEAINDSTRLWSEMTTNQWTTEVIEQWRRERHRAKMVRLRLRKKKRRAAMIRERHDLEKMLDTLLSTSSTPKPKVQSRHATLFAFQQLTAEHARLTKENLGLHKTLEHHTNFHTMIQNCNKVVHQQESKCCWKRRSCLWVSAIAESEIRDDATMVQGLVLHGSIEALATGPKQKKISPSKDLWETVMREQWRREQQRRRMVRWRQQKKEGMADMVHERRLREKQLQRRVLAARIATDRMAPHSFDEAFRMITIEKAALKRENLALKETIAQHVKFECMLQHDIKEFVHKVPNPTTEAVKPKTKETVMSLLQGEGGWRVVFPNGEPSFHFHPFTKDEFYSIVNNDDIVYAKRHPCTMNLGNIFGWSVDCAPLTRNADDTAFMTHTRFAKRVHCSIERADKLLPRLDKSKWPKLVTPRSWGLVQTGSFSCQELQNFHKDAHVMVCNIPGEVNLRYISLAQHTRNLGADGKRVDKYMITIADSEANFRNREAEGAQSNVQWIFEGGICVTIIEVDRSSIDVVFDQWADCLSEMHGREQYIDWIKFPVGLEQIVSPTNCLTFE